MSLARRSLFQFVFWFFLVMGTVFLLALIGGLLSQVEWATFRMVLHNEEFQFSVLLTLWTTLLATLLAAFLALPCGYILSRQDFRGKLLVDSLMDVPIVLPPLVSGVALLILFGPLLGDALARAGLDIVFSTRGVVVAQWFIATPFAIKAFKQAFDAIDPRLEKVARTLGYTPGGVFLHVTLPLARNGILGGLTMTWARALGEFGATAMLAGVTRMKTETLSVAIFLNMSIGDLHFALATAVVMLVVALALLVAFKSITGQGVSL